MTATALPAANRHPLRLGCSSERCHRDRLDQTCIIESGISHTLADRPAHHLIGGKWLQQAM